MSMGRRTSGSALLELSGKGSMTRSTAGSTGLWGQAIPPSGIRRGRVELCWSGAPRRQGLGIPCLPPGCPCLLRGRLNIPEKCGPSSAPGHGGFLVLVSFLGALLVLTAHGMLEPSFSSTSLLAVSSCVTGCCSRSTGYWISGQMTFRKNFSLHLHARSARFAWLDSGYMVHLFLALGKSSHIFYVGVDLLPEVHSLFFSIFADWRRVHSYCFWLNFPLVACSHLEVWTSSLRAHVPGEAENGRFLFAFCGLFGALNQLECRGREAVHRHCLHCN